MDRKHNVLFFKGTTIWFWGGGGWHFLEINILVLKKLKINNLSSSGKKINNLTFTFLELGEKVQIFQKIFGSLRS